MAYVVETIRYRGPKTWELLPSNIKNPKSLVVFKAKSKDWKPRDCTCRVSQLCSPCAVSLRRHIFIYLLRNWNSEFYCLYNVNKWCCMFVCNDRERG